MITTEDYVKRSHVLDLVEDCYQKSYPSVLARECVGDLWKSVQYIPMAEVFEKEFGYWVKVKHRGIHVKQQWLGKEYKCSLCGESMIGNARFCPNCGAKMLGSIKDNYNKARKDDADG